MLTGSYFWIFRSCWCIGDNSDSFWHLLRGNHCFLIQMLPKAIWISHSLVRFKIDLAVSIDVACLLRWILAWTCEFKLTISRKTPETLLSSLNKVSKESLNVEWNFILFLYWPCWIQAKKNFRPHYHPQLLITHTLTKENKPLTDITKANLG